MSPPVDPLHFWAITVRGNCSGFFQCGFLLSFRWEPQKAGPNPTEPHWNMWFHPIPAHSLLPLSIIHHAPPRHPLLPRHHNILALPSSDVESNNTMTVLRRTTGSEWEWQLAVPLTGFAVPWSPKLDLEGHGEPQSHSDKGRPGGGRRNTRRLRLAGRRWNCIISVKAATTPKTCLGGTRKKHAVPSHSSPSSSTLSL